MIQQSMSMGAHLHLRISIIMYVKSSVNQTGNCEETRSKAQRDDVHDRPDGRDVRAQATRRLLKV